jgi:ATP synthase F1 delta subunit
VAAEAKGVSGLAVRYALALFDLADERKALDAVANDLRILRGLLGDSAELSRLIRSPVISRGEQGKALAAVAQAAELSPLTRNFLGLLAQNRRLFALPAIIVSYLARLAERRGEVTARVVVAQALSAEQRAAAQGGRAQGRGRGRGRSEPLGRHHRQAGVAHDRRLAQEQALPSAASDEGGSVKWKSARRRSPRS